MRVGKMRGKCKWFNFYLTKKCWERGQSCVIQSPRRYNNNSSIRHANHFWPSIKNYSIFGVKLSPNSWTLHGIVPISAILNLNIILLTVLGKACHLKSVFECQLNYAPLDNNDPYTLVASSRVCRQSAFKGLVLVVVIFQYVSTGGCKKTSCQTKNAKCMYCTILS